MTDKTRKTMLLAVMVLLALSVAALWSYDFLDTQHSAAIAAQRDLRDSQDYALRIEASRDKPRLATEQEQVSSQTSALIEKAAAAAGVTADKIVRIQPEQAQELGESNYREKSTVLALKNVTMEQVVKLMHALSAGEPYLHAKALRLSCSDPADTTTWTAEVTLTYLIYDVQKMP